MTGLGRHGFKSAVIRDQSRNPQTRARSHDQHRILRRFHALLHNGDIRRPQGVQRISDSFKIIDDSDIWRAEQFDNRLLVANPVAVRQLHDIADNGAGDGDCGGDDFHPRAMLFQKKLQRTDQGRVFTHLINLRDQQFGIVARTRVAKSQPRVGSANISQ